jgi:diacylglycerol kinase
MTRDGGWRRCVRPFRHAARGVAILLRTQPNARVHAAATALVVLAAALLRVSALEWALLLAACALVWIAEALNTALEFLGDAITREIRPEIGKAKDVAAGAVLIASLAALALGALVFIPRVMATFAP